MSTPDPISEEEVMKSLPEHLRDNYNESAEKATDYLEELRKDRNVKFEHDIQVFGEGARQMPRFSAGSPKLNYILGGGWPKGRIVEIYGPESSGKTTIALHAIAEVQKRGGAVLFVDAEHSFDPIWAEAIGVNVRGLPIEQPTSGEDALGLIEHATQSGTFDLIVLDSVAALAPKAELEGEMGDSHVGLQARMMSQAMRKLVAATQRTHTTIMFLNQIRMKIGVRFGCFQYNARVVLADGSTEKIGKIVNQKMDVEVMSFDPKTGECRPRRIIGWHKNGKADHFLQITAEKAGGNGRSQMAVTPNHKIFTPHGLRRAGDLKVGDEVLGKALMQFTPMQRQLALGSTIGDGSLKKTGAHTIKLRVGHGEKQTAYAQWKASLMGDLVTDEGRNKNGSWRFSVRPSADMLEICEEAYSEDGRLMSARLLEEIDLFGVAIWYMDDAGFEGHYEQWGNGKAVISGKSYTLDELHRLADHLETLGIPRPTISEPGIMLWSGERTARFQELIARYVHPSMDWKIHPRLRGQFEEPDMGVQGDRYRMIPVKITEIREKPKTRSMQRFDLEIEGDHAYIVDGVGVHNSPETTPGGRALKFYSSIRLDCRRSTIERDGDVALGNKVRLQTKKNKTAPPFKKAETYIVYEQAADGSIARGGLDILAEELDLALDEGAIEKAGSWYKAPDENGELQTIGQGQDAIIDKMKTDHDFYDTVRRRIYDAGHPNHPGPAPEESE